MFFLVIIEKIIILYIVCVCIYTVYTQTCIHTYIHTLYTLYLINFVIIVVIIIVYNYSINK